MIPAGLRKVAYASIALKGLFATIAPRLSARIAATMSLPGFENTGELNPTDWYARAVRATGVGMLAAGGTALLLESRAEAASEDEDASDATFDGIDRIDTDSDDDIDTADLSVDIETDDEADADTADDDATGDEGDETETSGDGSADE